MYYVLWTALGYYVIKDLQTLPPMMGGSGDVANIDKEFPVWNKPHYFDLFYCASIGYHLESATNFIFDDRKSDFSEMLFHHVIAISLIFFCYISNSTDGGVLVLWLH